CRFEHQFESAGRYSVEVRDARYLGNVYWGYVLRMGSFPAARVASPSSVSGGSAVEVQLPELGGIAARASIPKVGRGDLFGEIRTSEHSLGSWVNLTLDSAPNVLENAKNSAEAPTRVVLPANLHGVLSEPGEEDWYEFELRRGETISFRGVARELASGADLELALIEP